MVKNIFGKISWGKFGLGLLIAFLGFQALSLILGNFFPIFKAITRSYSMVWLWIIFALLIFLVGRFVFNLKDFDRKSIFISLLALAILATIIIYFEIDLGQLFDMSIVKNQMGSTVKYLGSLVNP